MGKHFRTKQEALQELHEKLDKNLYIAVYTCYVTKDWNGNFHSYYAYFCSENGRIAMLNGLIYDALEGIRVSRTHDKGPSISYGAQHHDAVIKTLSKLLYGDEAILRTEVWS